MTTTSTKPTTSFWVIGIIALIWNLMGVMVYLVRAFMTEKMITALPEKQQAEFLIEYPSWVTVAFALAVFCGFLGALSLLFKKKWATLLFAISAIAAISQHIYIFLNIDVNSFVMPILVIVGCIFFVWYSKKCADDGLLN